MQNLFSLKQSLQALAVQSTVLLCLSKRNRFQRLRIAIATGERALPTVLTKLRDKGRKNVLIVPMKFCATSSRMRELQGLTAEFDDYTTSHWLPGLRRSLIEANSK